eukprot:COSAG01_NODE_686_length_14245_cov_95.096140_15_plen_74_part_00
MIMHIDTMWGTPSHTCVLTGELTVPELRRMGQTAGISENRLDAAENGHVLRHDMAAVAPSVGLTSTRCLDCVG